MYLIKYIFFAGIIFWSASLVAQSDFTEADVKSQDMLIAAKKEALLGRTDESIKLYKALLDEFNEPAAAYELSRIYNQLENSEQALNYARMAYDQDNANEWYLIQYTDLLNRNEEHLLIAELFDAHTEVEPKNKYHYLQASFHYLKAKKSKEAIELLDRLEKNAGASEEITLRKFEIYDVLGKHKDALKELKSLSDLYPNDTKYLHNIAGYLRTMGKDKDANKIMERILEIDPADETASLFAKGTGKNKDANYLRSLVPVIQDDRIDLDKKIIEFIPYLQEFADTGNPELGESLLDVSKILDDYYPNNAKVKSILGDIYFYQRNLPEAITNYKASIDIDKSVWSVWSQLLLSLNIAKEYEKMETISNDAIYVYPNQALAYYYNALALLEVGNLSESEMSAQEAGMINAGNESLKSEIQLVQSRIAFEKKKYEESLELLNAAMTKQEENNPRFLEHLGDLKMAMNNAGEAKKAYKKALDNGGDPERLNQKLEGGI